MKRIRIDHVEHFLEGIIKDRGGNGIIIRREIITDFVSCGAWDVHLAQSVFGEVLHYKLTKEKKNKIGSEGEKREEEG